MSEITPSFQHSPHSRVGGNFLVLLICFLITFGDNPFLLAFQGRRSASPTGIVQSVVGNGFKPFLFLFAWFSQGQVSPQRTSVTCPNKNNQLLSCHTQLDWVSTNLHLIPVKAGIYSCLLFQSVGCDVLLKTWGYTPIWFTTRLQREWEGASILKLQTT